MGAQDDPREPGVQPTQTPSPRAGRQVTVNWSNAFSFRVIFGAGKACEGCGYALPVAAHHPDYTKPLDVEWLCVDCHAGRHDEAQDMELGSFLFAFRQSEVAQARYEDDRAYFDWRNWPPN